MGARIAFFYLVEEYGKEVPLYGQSEETEARDLGRVVSG